MKYEWMDYSQSTPVKYGRINEPINAYSSQKQSDNFDEI